MLYQVKLKSVCAGVEASPDGIIVEAAPVFQKFVGAKFLHFAAWVRKNGGKVSKVVELCK